MATTGAGPMLREWRQRRRMSQMTLALEAGVSTRHLSFVETGRARPSAELLLALGRFLDLPLRDRNRLLLAGGFAPRFSESPLDAPEIAPVLDGLRRLLALHDPYPGVVLDRHWNIVLANEGAKRIVAALPAFLREPRINVFRTGLHPEGLAAITTNFEAWGAYLLDELERTATATGDATLVAIANEVSAYPNVAALRAARRRGDVPTTGVLVPCELTVGGVQLSFFTTLARVGTATDLTLAELTTELFYPADAATAAALQGGGGGGRSAG
jgi:transcriptional regulator with XRE-family HTH domain